MNKTEKLEQVSEFLENLGAYTQGSWDGLHDALVTVGDLIAEQSSPPATTLTREDLERIRFMADFDRNMLDGTLDAWFPTDPTDSK